MKREQKKTIMNCKLIEKKLIFYIDNELDAKDSASVRAHLDECPKCKFIYNQIYESLELINEDKLTDSNPFFYTRVMEGIRKKSAYKPELKWLPGKQFVLQTSLYLILGIFALLLGTYLGSGHTFVDETALSNQTDTTDYQLFANSYKLDLTQNVYTVEMERDEE
jgi:predicted anti-sigma-YlaC factor YlaD